MFSCEAALVVIKIAILTKNSLAGNRGGGGQRNFLASGARRCRRDVFCFTIPVADQSVCQSMAHGGTDPAAQRCDAHHGALRPQDVCIHLFKNTGGTR